MRLLIISIVFIFITTNVLGQIEVNLYFKNTCDNKVIQLEFVASAIDSISEGFQSNDGVVILPTTGNYHISSNYIWGDNLVGMFDHTIEVVSSNRLVDTLDIPMIKFTGDGVLHAKTPYWNYFKCEKICNGHEFDFYSNGQKRFEGEFINGKPSLIIEYRQDGTKEIEFWYIPGTQFYKRVNWFDKTGKLDEYDKYKNNKRRSIKTTYTSQGKRVGQEVIKYWTDK